VDCPEGPSREHPTSNAAADAPRIVRPKSLRLIKVGDLLTLGEGPHELHPAVLQVPHPLPTLLSTFKEVVMCLVLSTFPAISLPAASTSAAPHLALSCVDSRTLDKQESEHPLGRRCGHHASNHNGALHHAAKVSPVRNIQNDIVPHL